MPVAIEMPTSAAASAGASLMLSMSVAPLLINVGDWAVFGEPMHKRQWLGIGVISVSV